MTDASAQYDRMVVLDEEDRMFGQVVDHLRQSFPEVPDDTLVEIIGSVRRQFNEAPIRDFVPLFVERQAKEKLANLASAGPSPA